MSATTIDKDVAHSVQMAVLTGRSNTAAMCRIGEIKAESEPVASARKDLSLYWIPKINAAIKRGKTRANNYGAFGRKGRSDDEYIKALGDLLGRPFLVAKDASLLRCPVLMEMS